MSQSTLPYPEDYRFAPVCARFPAIIALIVPSLRQCLSSTHGNRRRSHQRSEISEKFLHLALGKRMDSCESLGCARTRALNWPRRHARGNARVGPHARTPQHTVAAAASVRRDWREIAAVFYTPRVRYSHAHWTRAGVERHIACA